ncbi:hypothetical protein CTAYLR_004712 [Chrysophaeum taylorii]|uniref:Uncharacterized protein n=1 Tax=Chrysophaeum taylorii TaxID=2483200 RepID=A0AAD7XIG6_9STRA|nr:hypothetical protein CTAYLR_004712 [Chrysophaeum taylorii]
MASAVVLLLLGSAWGLVGTSSVFVAPGVEVRVEQHFLESPIAQPRRRGRSGDLTGLKSWPTSVPLLRYLADGVAGLRVIELGAGSGTLGIGLAALGAHVVLTDPAIDVVLDNDVETNTLDLLQGNVDRNRAVVGDRAKVAPLVWGDAGHLRALAPSDFDLVVAADVLYNPDNYDALAATLATFNTRAVIGYQPRIPTEHRFFDAMLNTKHRFRLAHSGSLCYDHNLHTREGTVGRVCVLEPPAFT